MKRLGWMLLLLAGAVTGCDNGPRVRTGLPSDKQLKDLSESDLRTACQQTAAVTLSDAAYRGICASTLSESGVATCNSQLEACVTSSKQSASSADCDSGLADTAQQFSACTATVAEFEDCLSGVVDLTESFYSGVTCENPPTTDPPKLTSAPACATLQAKCPGLFS